MNTEKEIDVYDLINSKTISEYCRKIKHQFNIEEIAVLIYRNNKMSIEEKINTYNKVIEKYTDMEVIERVNCKHYDSVKTMIKQEISRLEELTNKLLEDEENSIYTYNEFDKNTLQYLETNNFDDVKSSFKEIETDIYKEYLSDEENSVTKFRIEKRHLKDDSYKKIIAEYEVQNKTLILKNIYSVSEESDIDTIFVNIPNPFKKGDILQYSNKIMVLDWIITDKENLKELLLKGNYDSLDMYGYCYLVNDKGNVYRDDIHNYDSWEYLSKELIGKERMLKTISSFLQEKIDLELLLKTYDYIKVDSDIGNFKVYTDEGLELAGLNEEDIIKIK